MLLAKNYDKDKVDPKGFIISEKLDGVRAYWDGVELKSRTNHDINAPKWFTDKLPHVPLDGELWTGRQSFQKTVSIVRKKEPIDEEWSLVKFMVFDMPTMPGPYEERISNIPNIDPVVPVKTWICRGHDHLMSELDKYLAKGAEGLMIRRPGSLYEAKRSSTLYKVKKFNDAEGIVDSYEDGKGKHKGRMGAIWLSTNINNRKIKFKIGTGFTDAERENPPEIGSVVTYRYTETTKDGVPKFASFLRQKIDSDL